MPCGTLVHGPATSQSTFFSSCSRGGLIIKFQQPYHSWLFQVQRLPQCPRDHHGLDSFVLWVDDSICVEQHKVVQYAKLPTLSMQRRAELQFRAGKRAEPVCRSTKGLLKFASQLCLTSFLSVVLLIFSETTV